MTTTQDQGPQTFAYQAVAADGQEFSGTIDAAGLDEANQKLAALRLQVRELSPRRQPRVQPLRGENFLAFNEQLGQLAKAGLPVEEGLRLIANDLRSGPLAATMRGLSADLERGQSLPQAIEAHRAAFPPLYAKLVDAGLKSGNLPAVLFNLSRHLATVRQLKIALWQAVSYPLMVILAAVAALVFMSFVVLPQAAGIYSGFKIQLPALTLLVLALGDVVRSQALWIVIGALIAAAIIVWQVLRYTGADRRVGTALALRMPMIGPIVRRSLISRWCDAVRVGIEAGLDLPASISLASDAINSAALKRDSRALVEILSAGGQLGDAPRGRLLPLVVVRAVQLAGQRNDLPRTLGMLSDMYQDQAQRRVEAVEGILAPILLILVGLLVALLALAAIAPLITFVSVF